MPERLIGVALSGALAIGLLAGCSSAHKAPTSPAPTAAVTARATLGAGAEVARPRHAPARAAGQFAFALKGSSLTWTLRFAHLSGKVTGAVIDEARAGANGPVIVALCGPCSSPVSGTTLLGSGAAQAIAGGRAYVNLQTKSNPAGEIRSQLKLAK